MGMTDKQFNGFVRFMYEYLTEALEDMPEGKSRQKVEKTLEILQQILED